MAKDAYISADDNWFCGEDKTFPCTILNDAETAAVNVATWALTWVLKTSPDAATATLTKTVGSGITVAGVFDANPATNLQRATIAIADTDTATLAPQVYYHELKRTDDGFETVLFQGPAVLKRAFNP